MNQVITGKELECIRDYGWRKKMKISRGMPLSGVKVLQELASLGGKFKEISAEFIKILMTGIGK